MIEQFKNKEAWEIKMNSNKKIILLLSLCLGFTKLNCSDNSTKKSHLVGSLAKEPSFKSGPVNNPANYMHSTVAQQSVSQKEMADAIALRQYSADKENLQNFEHRADELIKQNYKTDQMKYDILLFTKFNFSSTEGKSINLPSVEEIINEKSTQENINNFMVVNIATASIKNLPTIHDILTKTTEIDPKNPNKAVATKGLQATLRAINGAIADATFDKKSMLAADEIILTLRNMQKRIETRLNEINPTYWRHLALGVGALATIAAATSIYYSGITMKDSQEYIADLMKQYKPTDITETAKAAVSPDLNKQLLDLMMKVNM